MVNEEPIQHVIDMMMLYMHYCKYFEETTGLQPMELTDWLETDERYR